MSEDVKNLPVLVEISDKTDLDSLDEMTTKIKIKMVDEITKGGRVIPSDDDGVNTLLKVLGSIDGQTNNRRKIAVEEKAVDAASKAAANVAEIIKNAKGNPFSAAREIQGEVVSREPTELPEIELVEKQTHIGVDDLKYEDFVRVNQD